jgi:hypothetical protein
MSKQKELKMKTINDITMYDLMSDDLTVWIKRNEKFGFDLEIENYGGEVLVDEKGINPLAMESYADMCRRFVHFYDKLKAITEKEVNDSIGGEA